MANTSQPRAGTKLLNGVYAAAAAISSTPTRLQSVTFSALNLNHVVVGPSAVTCWKAAGTSPPNGYIVADGTGTGGGQWTSITISAITPGDQGAKGQERFCPIDLSEWYVMAANTAGTAAVTSDNKGYLTWSGIESAKAL